MSEHDQHETPRRRMSGEEVSAKQDAEIAELQEAWDAHGNSDMHGEKDDRPGDNGPAGGHTPFKAAGDEPQSIDPVAVGTAVPNNIEDPNAENGQEVPEDEAEAHLEGHAADES